MHSVFICVKIIHIGNFNDLNQLLVDRFQALFGGVQPQKMLYCVQKSLMEVHKMILADKIIKLRKKNRWSQEELADKMNVSRQAVSKWEGAQTVPDLERILQMSALFGVTTDYLLKDEVENEEYTDSDDNIIRRVSLKDANEYMALRLNASKRIALATFLCIISVIPLILLGSAAELSCFLISENTAAVIGLVFLLVSVTIAVAIYIFCGFKNTPYEFLDKEPFETEYGVRGMVTEKKKEFRNTYIKSNIIGTCLCVISPVALFISALIDNEFIAVIMVCIMLLFCAIGVVLFITAGVRHASMQKLLKEGDYAEKKGKNKLHDTISKVYWLIVLAIFLTWTFFSNLYESWVVWPIAGVLYVALIAILNYFTDNNE